MITNMQQGISGSITGLIGVFTSRPEGDTQEDDLNHITK